MTTLVPRRLSELVDWFDGGFRFGDNHAIRVEDRVSDSDYELRAELPGVDPKKDMQVRFDDGVLSIHAERPEEKTSHGRSEFAYGSFDRSVRLPRNADGNHISARYDSGVLTVSVPLTAAEPAGTTIPIAVASAKELGANGSEKKPAAGKK